MATFIIKLNNYAVRLEEEIQVTPSMLIADIRAQAALLFHTDASSQLLLFWHDIKLADTDTIRKVSVQPGDTIIVQQRQVGGITRPPTSQTALTMPSDESMDVCMCTMVLIHTDSATIPVRVAEADTVKTLLDKLNFPKGPGDILQLRHDTTLLEEKQFIRDLHLPDRTSLYLVVRAKGGVFQINVTK